ncbi:serine hydrolase domain-containing protein [Lentzea sp. NPDC058436]|uniref:serine hydrolase domain-containing protein n=1 Tax=Lentzea sp. NPDC058436 TaxID=3346499 RepID=UPI0036639BE6
MGSRLEELITEHGVPGAQVAVLANGEVRDEVAGVLSAHTRVEVTHDSVFKVGSITKIWTATLVQQLVDEGLLDLDRPVCHHLPGFTASIASRHLLTHTSGIDANHFFETGRNGDAIERFVVALQAQEHGNPPGVAFSYSNSGFVVLGRLVEVLRGKPFHDVVRDHLVTPLGLRTVATDADEAILHRVAVGHDESGLPVRRWAVAYGTAPSGSHFAMSARELLAFARLHLDDPKLAGLRTLQVEDVPDLGIGVVGWGLGWMLHRNGVVGHTGVSKGQKAFLRIAPAEGLAVAVLTNSVHGEAVAQKIFTEAGLTP